ncbi:MAG: hypothetical protein ABIO57_03825 [Candidatus Paceibacterota bacterium]
MCNIRRPIITDEFVNSDPLDVKYLLSGGGVSNITSAKEFAATIDELPQKLSPFDVIIPIADIYFPRH